MFLRPFSSPSTSNNVLWTSITIRQNVFVPLNSVRCMLVRLSHSGDAKYNCQTGEKLENPMKEFDSSTSYLIYRYSAIERDFVDLEVLYSF